MKNTFLLMSFMLLGFLSESFAALPPIYDYITEVNRYAVADQMEEGKTAKSDIKITYPNSKTTWALPRYAKIDWETANIEPEKKIRFYLVKDDVVVQDLGIFQNSKSKDNIRLDRGLATGNNYRVMGIEQNPVDKFHIAKYSTPFFTIIKAPRKKKEAKVLKKAPAATAKIESTTEVAKEDVPKLRHTFDGRSISYNKVLEVESTKLVISLWDHGRTDGDIVSIYLNGEAVVYKHSLTYKKKIYEINLKSGMPNDLFLYAHNLGRFAPNTVAMEIIDGNKSENIVLNSDLQSCEAVVIKVKE